MSRVTYLVNKSLIVVHREHGVSPIRWRAGCPLTPLVFAAMLRQEAKAQGLSPTLNPERALLILRGKEKKKKRTKTKSAPLLGYQSNPPLLSCTPQPLFPCWCMATASLRKPQEHNMKNKSRELSTAPTLPLPLSLPPTAFIQGSIKCFWQTSIRQSPREISALTSRMLCCAQFGSAEPPSSVAPLPKTSLWSQGVK